jgi:hypothetical protein
VLDVVKLYQIGIGFTKVLYTAVKRVQDRPNLLKNLRIVREGQKEKERLVKADEPSGVVDTEPSQRGKQGLRSPTGGRTKPTSRLIQPG